LFSALGSISITISFGGRFSRILHAPAYAVLTEIRDTGPVNNVEERVLIGPSPHDWPFSTEDPLAIGPPDELRPTRYGLALANYLEKQDARRAVSSRSDAATIHQALSLSFDWWLRLAAAMRFVRVGRIPE
jgi:hypothetical protein